MNPLDFALVRENYPDRWDRVRNGVELALVERVAWDRWIVTLPDGGEPWKVRLRSDHGAYEGACEAPPGAVRDHDRCPGHKWHDGPCAHLCTVRLADWCNRNGMGPILDTRGEEIRVHDVEEVYGERGDAEIEPDGRADVRADGGGPL